MKTVKPYRGDGPNRRLPMGELQQMFGDDGKVWCTLAVVKAPGEGAERWFLDEGRIYVEVETVPEGDDLTARLGSSFGGPNAGLWAIPAEGALVLVAIPSGATDFIPVIVAVTDSGHAPDGVSDDKTLLHSQVPLHQRAPTILLGPNADVVEITGTHTYSRSNDIQLGSRAGTMIPLQDGVVVASGIDTFTGVPYGLLGSASTKVQAEK